jgi:hypothetical protein
MTRCLVAVLVVLLAACSGGGTTVPAASSGRSSNAVLTATSLKIVIPHAASTSSQARTPQYISSSTQSLTLNVTPASRTTPVTGFPITANLTTTSPGCTTTSNATVCVTTLTLIPGTYDATVTTFDAANGTGIQLSAAQDVPFTVVLNQANSISLVLGGTPASIQIVAGTNVTLAHPAYFTLPGNASGAIEAYGVDADGNTIVGAGSPTVTATTTNATQISVTQPLATAPNTIGVATLNDSAIASVTATITPASGAGGSPLSQTFVVQSSSTPLLYIASGEGHVFNLAGTDVTPSGSAFTTAFSGSGGVGMVFDPASGFLYATSDNGSVGTILAFDKNGNQQTLNAATTGLSIVGGITLNPNNGWLYVAGLSTAFDAAGNPHTLSSALPLSFTITFDPVHNVIVDGTQTYNAAGVQQSTLPFTGQIDGGVVYNAYNGFFYVATVYPTKITAYDTSGNPQVLSGTFINNSTEQIGGLVADPITGNIFLATNAHNTYGFDANGNALPAPWHNITTVGASSGAAGLTLVAP